MNIKDLRNNIDEIDEKIISLLESRFTTSENIGKIKKEQELPVLDNKREDEIFKKIKDKNFEREITNIYKCILEESKKVQKI